MYLAQMGFCSLVPVLHLGSTFGLGGVGGEFQAGNLCRFWSLIDLLFGFIVLCEPAINPISEKLKNHLTKNATIPGSRFQCVIRS